MRIKVRSKKRFLLWFCILIFISLNLAFALNRRSIETSLQRENPNIENKQLFFASDKDGSIFFEESKFFKKYVIECTKEIQNINFLEDDTSINLYIKRDEISKLNIRAEKNTNLEGISFQNLDDSIEIKIVKAYKDNNFVYIDKNNNRNIIVLVSKELEPFHHTVVLDSGHGGVDKGANFGSIYEKDITLKLSKYTSEELKFNGFRVTLTRDTDKLLSLREVGDITNAASGDLFVSLHVNENKESKFKGITTYYYDLNGYQKEERVRLAKTIQKELVKTDGWQDRGILRQNLAVLRYSKIPGVLLECGFLSNSEDREKLKDEKVIINLSKNITKGIINYLAIE